MPISDRAKQFMPFDALKGLRDALRLKEFEHEKVTLGELSEDEAQKISDTLSSLKNGDSCSLSYESDGHILTASGKVKLQISEGQIIVDDETVPIDSIYKISKTE